MCLQMCDSIFNLWIWLLMCALPSPKYLFYVTYKYQNFSPTSHNFIRVWCNNMNVFSATCASNRSLQTVINPSSKENYARSRSTSLKYLIISCVNLTLSIQNFVCYYLQLVKPYAMFYRVLHQHFLMLRFKFCLLIIFLLLCFTGVQCDQEKNTKYVHQLATNESFNLLASVSISRVTKFRPSVLKYLKISLECK